MTPAPSSSLSQGAQALTVVTDLLGLRPATATDDNDNEAVVLGVVEGRGGPRFLLPIGQTQLATSACLSYLGLRDHRTRLNRRVLAGALKVGASQLVIRGRFVADAGPGSLLAHLQHVLGHAPLHVAVGLGNLDEVWKPTLQVFATDGTPLAYVKVGRGPIGAHLVSTELAALSAWATLDDPRLVVPGLIAAEPWNEMPLACTQPMPGDVRRLPPGPISAWGVRTLDDPIDPRPIDAAPWWTARVQRFADHAEIAPVLARVAERHRQGDRTWARSHGDWVPWNLARSSRGLVAWDWEYSEAGAPVGLDETHLTYQRARVQRGRSVPEALATARSAAPSPWIADAHLAMLITRAGQLASLHGSPFGDHDDLMAAAAGIWQ